MALGVKSPVNAVMIMRSVMLGSVSAQMVNVALRPLLNASKLPYVMQIENCVRYQFHIFHTTLALFFSHRFQMTNILTILSSNGLQPGKRRW